ncbi:MAG: hypothetical protein SGILL_008451, partial [Bacillariaceae sp.]
TIDKACDSERCISIDDAVDECGFGTFQWIMTAILYFSIASDFGEAILLSFLTIILQGLWDLSYPQTSTLFASVMIGQMVGCVLLAPMGDMFGRRKTLIAIGMFISIFGFLTATASGFGTFVFYRFMVGFGIGGITVPFDSAAELVPTQYRGKMVTGITSAGPFGALLVLFLTWLVFGESGTEEEANEKWRLLVAITAIPPSLAMIAAYFFIPESPRWLLSQGRSDEALKILRQIAKKNGKNEMEIFPEGTRLEEGKEQEDKNVLHLFKPTYRKVTLALMGMFFATTFAYYAIVELTSVFAIHYDNTAGGDLVDTENHMAYDFNYFPLVLGSGLEFAFCSVPLFLVDPFGRKKVAFGLNYVGAIMLLAFAFVPSQLALSILLAAARVCNTAFFGVMTLQATEILPTSVRTTGHALFNFCARAASAASPYLVHQEAFGLNWVGLIVMGFTLLTIVFTSFLPETAGKILGGVVEHIVGAKDDNFADFETGTSGKCEGEMDEVPIEIK